MTGRVHVRTAGHARTISPFIHSLVEPRRTIEGLNGPVSVNSGTEVSCGRGMQVVRLLKVFPGGSV